jgi:hypothetical protein
MKAMNLRTISAKIKDREKRQIEMMDSRDGCQ